MKFALFLCYFLGILWITNAFVTRSRNKQRTVDPEIDMNTVSFLLVVYTNLLISSIVKQTILAYHT